MIEPSPGGPYQALLVVSFGGPEGPDDVMPFLENVLRGRNVPRERMLAVAEHYMELGGRSPINEQNRALIAALEALLAREGPRLPIYFGNRNWHPLLPDTVKQMRDDGVERALAFVTSAFSSYSSCRQYRENIAEAQGQVGDDAPRIDKLRAFYNHPKFIETMADRTRAALDRIDPELRPRTTVLFTAHSIPVSMAAACAYAAQLDEAADLVAAAASAPRWRVVYQSRSGPPSQPWLDPDVCDAIDAEADREQQAVVVVPLGFVSDHVEVLHDLDHEAAARAASRGLQMVRAATAGTHPTFVSMIRDLIVERLDDRPDRPALGHRGALPDACPRDCCPAPAARPVAAQR